MRALVQRVSRASVSVEGRQLAAIGPGLLVLLGVAPEDTEAEADRLADKVRALRIFDDADGRMNEPLGEREVLCVSQFTLYADTRKGNRPGFSARRAARGGRAPVRALLRAPGRKAGDVRRPNGGRAGQRRPRDADAGGLIQASMAVPATGSACVAARLAPCARPRLYSDHLFFTRTLLEVGTGPPFFRRGMGWGSHHRNEKEELGRASRADRDEASGLRSRR